MAQTVGSSPDQHLTVRSSMAQTCMAPSGLAQHSVAQHGTAQHGTAPRGSVPPRRVEHGTAWHTWSRTVPSGGTGCGAGTQDLSWHSNTRCSTVAHGTSWSNIRYGNMWHRMVQNSTYWHGTGQDTSAQNGLKQHRWQSQAWGSGGWAQKRLVQHGTGGTQATGTARHRGALQEGAGCAGRECQHQSQTGDAGGTIGVPLVQPGSPGAGGQG